PASFFLSTSDVSSIIAVMDQTRIPKSVSIPISVMFRFFPAFSEEKKNIKLAMKMRGITPLRPLKYFEYVSVPLLISSSKITDDIAKAAETKCIADPCEKVRYRAVRIKAADYVYFFSVLIPLLLGMWLHGS
ncbi:MAG: energy-coupling factor transporter transmembrane component T, partial [Bacillota bacterium]|nr:energy-coupling factor transporter transmembrane component T [Bacillota bacterium]